MLTEMHLPSLVICSESSCKHVSNIWKGKDVEIFCLFSLCSVLAVWRGVIFMVFLFHGDVMLCSKR